MRKSVFFLVFIFICGITSGHAAEDLLVANVNQQNDGDFAGYKSHEIVVKFSLNLLQQIDIPRAFSEGRVGIAQIDSFAEANAINRFKQRYPHAPLEDINGEVMNLQGWFKAYFNSEIDAETVARALKKLQGVVDAQPIGIHNLSVVNPNDPNYTGGDMWYLDQLNDSDVDAPEAWDINRGSSNIIVAVLDSGTRYYHKDLGGVNASPTNPENARGNMWTNSNELGGTPGVDDDGNGFIDDWVGWDFVDNINPLIDNGDDYDVADNDPRDYNGHGTHTSGTVGAISDNGYAVASVAGGNGESAGVGNGVKVMGLRIGWDILITGQVGMDFAAEALIYAADNGALIASCSWGSSNSGGLGDAINYFLYGTTTPTTEPRQRLIFKAAGNDDDEGSDYMLDRSDVIGVASTDQNDVKSSFSTYGTFVDISAPGTDIMSTYHDYNDDASDYVASLSGTSMATPCAASVAALVWGHNQALTADEVETILLSTADDIESIPGNAAYIGKLGSGRVNAFAAVQQADASLPVNLTSFTAGIEQGNVKLTWTTESEINNSGFAVLRSNEENGTFTQIADFRDSEELLGQGTSALGKEYSFTDYGIVEEGEYWYMLEDIDFNGRRTSHGSINVFVTFSADITKNSATVPAKFGLRPNYPNPFNPTTRFGVNLPAIDDGAHDISVAVYDLLGRKVKTLYKGTLAAGSYTFSWDGLSDAGAIVPSGMYLYRVATDRFNQTRKMVLMK